MVITHKKEMKRPIIRCNLEKAVLPSAVELMNNCSHVQASDIIRVIKQHHQQYTDDDILNIYVFGSRLYGTATSDSDFDLIAIVTDSSFANKVTRVTDQHATVSEQAHLRKTSFIQCEDNNNKLDITIYSKSYYMQKMHAYNAYELMAIWLPDTFRIQERFNLLEDWPDLLDDEPAVALPKIRKTFSSQCNGVWKVSKTWFTDALKSDNEEIRRIDIYKAKKGFIATLRIFQFGAQIATNGCITDFSSCNQYMQSELVSDEEMQDFNKFHDHFRPIYVKLHHHFQDVAPA